MRMRAKYYIIVVSRCTGEVSQGGMYQVLYEASACLQ